MPTNYLAGRQTLDELTADRYTDFDGVSSPQPDPTPAPTPTPTPSTPEPSPSVDQPSPAVSISDPVTAKPTTPDAPAPPPEVSLGSGVKNPNVPIIDTAAVGPKNPNVPIVEPASIGPTATATPDTTPNQPRAVAAVQNASGLSMSQSSQALALRGKPAGSFRGRRAVNVALSI